jgi:catechol 2,3-dioxygenase-like lactoylglutathione lyase family enzyme
MITSLAISQIFVLDQDQALQFYVDKLGLEVSNDVDLGFMRWLTVRVPGEDRDILLERPGPPGYDPATAESVREMVTKGASGGTLIFNADDAHATYAELRAKGVELGEEPTKQSYGIDFALRDPFGNNLRIVQRTAPEEQLA